MTKYILHGGFTREDNESNRGFYDEFMKDVPDGGTVLLVYFAARDEKDAEKTNAHIQMCKDASIGKTVDFVVASREHFIEEIKKADTIFFNGGSTSKLMREMEPFGNFKTSIEGKTIAGSSAGAYMMATYGASHSEEILREGLGLVPVRLICHYQSPKLPPSELSVDLLLRTAQEFELIYLKDFEWKVFNS